MNRLTTMTGRLRATVPLLPALMAGALTACGTAGPPGTAMQDGDGEIAFERNSEFSGPRLRMFLTLQDGSEASVNTTDDAIGTRPGETPIPGHEARDWTFLKDVETGTTLAHALVSWNPGSPADYLMAGWWIQFPGQHLPELSLADSEQYAIVDGPEIDPANPPQLPLAGEATYTGSVGGAYRYVPEGDRDAAVVEEYRGTITLSADFGSRTLSGCVGCVGELAGVRAHFGAVLGDEAPDGRALIADYELHLGAAAIGPEGNFEAADIAVRHPERTQVRTEGFWGGLFSNIPNVNGEPRLVAGFSSAVFSESDGGEAVIVGAFVAPADRSGDP